MVDLLPVVSEGRVKRVAFDPAAGARAGEGKKIRTDGGGSGLYWTANLQSASGPLLVCEGELDAMHAQQHGFPAVTGTAGAGTFRAEWAREIAEAAREGVVTCYDGDEAGRENGAKVARKLASEGVTASVAELPQGKDVNDVLTEEGPERLREIVGEAMPYEPQDDAAPVVGVLASEVEREPIRWIWKGRLARGETTVCDGDPGLGKSTMLCDLAARITTGRPLPGEDRPPRDGPGGVVLVTTEDSP
jgi:5S rRNA maturation endonuclease (ribonuclease M5)